VKRFSVRLAALLFVACGAAAAALTLWSAVQHVRTADQNGDGRPDVWRHFDARGQITRIDVDSNFDGKPDIEEYYERGVLVRRESDRDFNGQADLVEEFDASTHGQTRAVVDVDYDGTADLLVLFRDGRPVYSTTACTTCRGAAKPAANTRAADAPLVPLNDPFASETAIVAHHRSPDDPDTAGLSTAGGLPSERAVSRVPLAPASFVAVADVHPRTPALLLQRSPRAPPAL
jgi:hypothetical protein